MHAANATHRILVNELAVPPPLPLPRNQMTNNISTQGSTDNFLGLPLPGMAPLGFSGRAAASSSSRIAGGAAATQHKSSSAAPPFPVRSYNKENAHSDVGTGRGSQRRAGRDARGQPLGAAAVAAHDTAALGPIPIPKFQLSSFFSGDLEADDNDDTAQAHRRAKRGPHEGMNSSSGNGGNAAPGVPGSSSSQFHTAKSAAAAEAVRSRAAATAAAGGLANRSRSRGGGGKPLVAFGTATAASDAAAAARTAPSTSKGQRRTRSKRKKARAETAAAAADVRDQNEPTEKNDTVAADHRVSAVEFVEGEGTPPIARGMTPPPPPPPPPVVVGPAGLPDAPLYKVVTPRRGRTPIVRLPSYASLDEGGNENDNDEEDVAAAGAASSTTSTSRARTAAPPPPPPPPSHRFKNSPSKGRSKSSESSAPVVPAVDSTANNTASAADGAPESPAAITAPNAASAAAVVVASTNAAPRVADEGAVSAAAASAPVVGVTLYRANDNVTWMANGVDHEDAAAAADATSDRRRSQARAHAHVVSGTSSNDSTYLHNVHPNEGPAIIELSGAGNSGSGNGSGSYYTGAWNPGPEIGTRWATTSIPMDSSSSTSCVPGWPNMESGREGGGGASVWSASEVLLDPNEQAWKMNHVSQGLPGDYPASPPQASSTRDVSAEPLTPTEEEEENGDGTGSTNPTTPLESLESAATHTSTTISAPNTTSVDDTPGSTAGVAANEPSTPAPASSPPAVEGVVGSENGAFERRELNVSGASGGAAGATGRSSEEALSEAELDLMTLLVLKGLVDQGKDSSVRSSNSSSNSSNSSSSAGWILNSPWPALAQPQSHVAFSHFSSDSNSDYHQSAAAAAAASEQRAQAVEFAKASSALLTLVQEALASGRAAVDKERALLAQETELCRREVHGNQQSRPSTAAAEEVHDSGDNAANSLNSLAPPRGNSHPQHGIDQDQHRSSVSMHEPTSGAANDSLAAQQDTAAALRESVRSGVREGLASGLRESLEREMRFAWLQSGYAGSSVYRGETNDGTSNTNDHHNDGGGGGGGTFNGVAIAANDYANRDNDPYVAWFGRSNGGTRGGTGGRNLRESVRASVAASFDAGAAHTAAAAAVHGNIRGNSDGYTTSANCHGHDSRVISGSSRNHDDDTFSGASDASYGGAAAAVVAEERAERDHKEGDRNSGSTTATTTNATGFKSNWGRMLQGGSRWHEARAANH